MTKLYYVLILILMPISAIYAYENLPPSPLEDSDQPFDVLEYNIHLQKLDFETNYLQAYCEIDVQWLSEADAKNLKFYFHLEGLTIDSAISEFYAEDGELIEREVFSQFELLNPDDEATRCYSLAFDDGVSSPESKIRVYYQGEMTTEQSGSFKWGGVQHIDSIMFHLGACFHTDYVSAARHWMPCYDHPGDKASYMIHTEEAELTMPPDFAFLDGSNPYKSATYLMAFAAGEFEVIEFTHPDLSFPVKVYTRAEDKENSLKAYANTPEMILRFAEVYGDYPYDSLSYVNTPLGSMEHQTFIALAHSLIKGYNKNPTLAESTIAHELAHQWFGNLVTPRNFRHTWLTESFAEFSETYWLESHSRKAYLDWMFEKSRGYTYTVAKNEGVFSLYDYDREAPSSNYARTIYDKGAVVLHTLREKLGDEKFFAGLRAYLDKYKYGNANTSEFTAAVEETTGENLTEFWDTWVYGIGWPKLNVAYDLISKDGDSHTYMLTISQMQNPEWGLYDDMDVELSIFDKDYEKSQAIFRLEKEPQTIEITLNNSLKSVIEGRDSIVSLFSVEDVYPVSVYENEVAPPLTMYYNSLSDAFIAESSRELINAEVSIIDIFGNFVSSGEFSGAILQVPAKHLQSGSYIFIVKNGKNYQSKKVNIVR